MKAKPEQGEPIPHHLRLAMEKSLGTNLSDVRVHKGHGRGLESLEARKNGAKAFAQGTEIFFVDPRVGPHSKEGVALMGHELAHVVQQKHGR